VRRSRTLTLLAAVGLLSALVVAPVGAEPSSDDVRQDLRSAEERLQELQLRVGAVVEDYNEAQAALDEATAALESTEEELAVLEAEVGGLTELAGDYARRLHKMGPTLELSSVFAGEIDEIGARTTALRRIMEGQRTDLEELVAARTSLDAAEARLAEQHEQAAEREAEVAARREQVEATMASSQEEIA
jgi:peptidoglycan hydrolase CwlO-like protein